MLLEWRMNDSSLHKAVKIYPISIIAYIQYKYKAVKYIPYKLNKVTDIWT